MSKVHIIGIALLMFTFTATCVYIKSTKTWQKLQLDKYKINLQPIFVSNGLTKISYPEYAFLNDTIIIWSDKNESIIHKDSTFVRSNYPDIIKNQDNKHFVHSESLCNGIEWKFALPSDISLIGKKIVINISRFYHETKYVDSRNSGKYIINEYVKTNAVYAIDSLIFVVGNKSEIQPVIDKKEALITRACIFYLIGLSINTAILFLLISMFFGKFNLFHILIPAFFASIGYVFLTNKLPDNHGLKGSFSIIVIFSTTFLFMSIGLLLGQLLISVTNVFAKEKISTD